MNEIKKELSNSHRECELSSFFCPFRSILLLNRHKARKGAEFVILVDSIILGVANVLRSYGDRKKVEAQQGVA